jgi:hypothetical protein
LTTTLLLEPYGYLAKSMNFWRLSIRGQKSGVSVRFEVYTFTRHGQLLAKPVPSPEPPPDHDGKWGLEHLIYVAGLPIPADLALAQHGQQPVATVEELRDLDPEDLHPEDLDFKKLVDRWHAMTRPTPALKLTKKLVWRWLTLANRTFIDEVDTFPSIALGEPPSAKFDDAAALTFHELRGRIGECRRLLRRVSAAPRAGRPPIVLGDAVVTEDQASSTALGNLWGMELAQSATFDNRRLLTPLSNVLFGRSEWSAISGLRLRLYLRAFDVTPDAQTDQQLPGLPVAKSTSTERLTLIPPPTLAGPLPDNWVTFAHEVSHAFDLGDEYVERAEDYPGTERDLDDDANLTTTAAIVFLNHRVELESIKWNWHRVRKGAVITRPVDDKLNGLFHAFVAKGHGTQFVPGDGVRLRKRDPRTVIGANPVISIVEFQVKSVHPNNLDDPHDDLNMTIVLWNDSFLIDVTPFGPGSVIYAPVLDPPLPFLYLTLISPAAERIMNATEGAMTGADCDLNDQADNGGVPQSPVKDPAGNVQHGPRLVGIYFGGARYACGILHPAGQCLMRDSSDAASRFCPVCQYVLIDRIDPLQHARFDQDYNEEYPM